MQRFFAVLLLIFSPVVVAEENSLTFFGSYYDRGDAFTLEFDFSTDPVEVSWKGAKDQDFRSGPQANPEWNEIRFNCSPEEGQILRQLVKHFRWAHGGNVSAIGSGLSIRAHRKNGVGDSFEYSYFACPYDLRLGMFAQEVPQFFERLTADGKLLETERQQYFAKLDQFATLLKDYGREQRKLSQSFESRSQVDWLEIAAAVVKTSPPTHGAWLHPRNGFREHFEAVLDILFSGKSAEQIFGENSGASRIVWIDRISSEYRTEKEWGLIETAAPPLFGKGDRTWNMLPSDLKYFVEDFVDPGFTKDLYPELSLLPGFDDPEEDRLPEKMRVRREFIAQSGFGKFLSGGQENAEWTSALYSLEFEQYMSRCVAMTLIGEKPFVTELRRTGDDWKIHRHVDYETYHGASPVDPFGAVR